MPMQLVVTQRVDLLCDACWNLCSIFLFLATSVNSTVSVSSGSSRCPFGLFEHFKNRPPNRASHRIPTGLSALFGLAAQIGSWVGTVGIDLQVSHRNLPFLSCIPHERATTGLPDIGADGVWSELHAIIVKALHCTIQHLGFLCVTFNLLHFLFT